MAFGGRAKLDLGKQETLSEILKEKTERLKKLNPVIMLVPRFSHLVTSLQRLFRKKL